MIKKLLGALALTLTCSVAVAAGSAYELDHAPDRINNMASLQNGAKLFVNYCLNCHSASSMRYNKLNDIGLTDDEIKKNLLFTSDKVGDLMTVAMRKSDGTAWFGVYPPDLSVIARAKATNLGPSGVDYVYTFLRTFYRDTSKLSGWNNVVFPSVAMPNVLWQRQGPVNYIKTEIHQVTENGNISWEHKTTQYDAQGFAKTDSKPVQDYLGGEVVDHIFEAPSAAQQSQFDNDVADLANFLGWMAEPDQLVRKKIGVWVLLFLGLFLVVAWRLNAAYWKHVK
ncbi:MAG: cytochrome c1 [Pusillimonas sp.]|nr:cytochrome c1 [Pusillimonas sp.]